MTPEVAAPIVRGISLGDVGATACQKERFSTALRRVWGLSQSDVDEAATCFYTKRDRVVAAMREQASRVAPRT